jgi:16S rRNA (cytosine967-C5)-methyltransferase
MDRIPAHAALSESVELCRAFGEPFATGMVNAVLRKVAAAQKPGNRIFESIPAFAERLAHPRWLVERWVAAYGREAALEICEAGQREPDAAAMFADSASNSEDPAMPIMDDGSRLVAELAAAAVPDAKKIWDCCAAPGGKTLVLALRATAAEVLATDVSGKRTAQMKARLARYGYGDRVKCAVVDASVVEKKDEGEFDLILCDVPCSGTGTLARNPEIRHRVSVEEIRRQVARQKEILAAAVKRLAPGGRLVYSTCSLEREENEDVVAGVTGLRRVGVEELVAGLKEQGRLGADVDVGAVVNGDVLRTLPGNAFDGDGFFAAVFERER